MNQAKTFFILSILVVIGLCGLLFYQQNEKKQSVTENASLGQEESLVFYCAAGIKPPVEATAKQYEKECGVPIQLQYGGSGTLLNNLTVSQKGDLYLAGDETYIEIAKEKGLVAETLPAAYITPVIAVRKGNPKSIQSIEDLWQGDVKVAMGNPSAASIGRTVEQLLERSGDWGTLESRITVFKPTVNEVANDVKIGSVDAGIVWDAVANQYPELEIVRVPELDTGRQQITIAVLQSSANPRKALRFARYLTARDKGLLEFEKYGYDPVKGDVWAETPEVVFFSGGVNRVAIQETIEEFEKREGCIVNTSYNGCGILVGQMKTGTIPDAYFACDVSFMTQVADIFLDSIDISATDMVIAVPEGNPKGIQAMKELAASGLKIGVANEEQSALGALTKRLLEEMSLYDAVTKNVVARTPTADLLVNQIRTGSLDAVIVYEANTAHVKDQLDILRIDHPAANAIQPFAVSMDSDHRYLMECLLRAIRSKTSRDRFESVGFRWRNQ